MLFTICFKVLLKNSISEFDLLTSLKVYVRKYAKIKQCKEKLIYQFKLLLIIICYLKNNCYRL